MIMVVGRARTQTKPQYSIAQNKTSIPNQNQGGERAKVKQNSVKEGEGREGRGQDDYAP